MSVRSDQRKDSPCEFLNSAHELEKLTIQLAVRENAIPKRYRFILGQPMCDAARAVNRNITYANSIYPQTKAQYERRKAYQALAKSALADLLELMRLASELLPVKNTVMTQWQGWAYSTQKALAQWVQSDASRYMDLK